MWWLAMRNSADVRTLGICGAKWMLLLLFWHLYPMIPTFLIGIPVFVMSLNSFFIATLVHNAMHRDVFGVVFVEVIWRLALSSTFGFPVEAYRPTHNLNHHVHTQHEKDHLHTSQMKFRSPIVNLLLYFPTVYPSIARLENEWVAQEFKKRSPKFLLFLSQVLAAHGPTATFLWLDWRRCVLLWLLPNILGVDGIISINLFQHHGCDIIQPGDYRGEKMAINSCRNFTGPMLNWLTCNNGYHTIHHMYSTIHWSEHPAMHAKLIEPYIDPRLEENCILRFLWRAYISPGNGPECLDWVSNKSN